MVPFSGPLRDTQTIPMEASHREPLFSEKMLVNVLIRGLRPASVRNHIGFHGPCHGQGSN